MKLLGATLLLALLIGCQPSRRMLPVDRVELRLSGWTALDVEVSRSGDGRYHLSEPYPQGRSGAFRVGQRDFDLLLERLAAYRREAVPTTRKSAREFIESGCPSGNFVTDQGAVYVRWIGPKTDEHYLADLGCDQGKHAARNEDLSKIIDSLPVPIS